jgi:hypothetical protein
VQVIAVNRHPNKTMKSVTFLANTSEDLMHAFMYLEQGDKVRITETQPAHTGNYYIQGIKSTIYPGSGVVYFTWYLKESIETICEPIGVWGAVQSVGSWTGSPARPTKHNALDFGILPYLSNPASLTYSTWIKRTSSSTFAILISRSAFTDASRKGSVFAVDTNGELYFKSHKTPTDGEWETTNGVVGQDVWTHVLVTYDNTTSSAVPKFYVDGSLVSPLTTLGTPNGTTDDDSDCPVILLAAGRDPALSEEYHSTNANIQMKDARIYNRTLTQAEISELANGEDDYTTVQTGLMFNGIYAPSENIGDYMDAAIYAEDLVLESVHGAAGIPYNEDISDLNFVLSGVALQP